MIGNQMPFQLGYRPTSFATTRAFALVVTAASGLFRRGTGAECRRRRLLPGTVGVRLMVSQVMLLSERRRALVAAIVFLSAMQRHMRM